MSSFPRKRESRKCMITLVFWTPASAGVTRGYDSRPELLRSYLSTAKRSAAQRISRGQPGTCAVLVVLDLLGGSNDTFRQGRLASSSGGCPSPPPQKNAVFPGPHPQCRRATSSSPARLPARSTARPLAFFASQLPPRRTRQQQATMKQTVSEEIGLKLVHGAL